MRAPASTARGARAPAAPRARLASRAGSTSPTTMPGPLVPLGDDRSPRIDQHRVAVGAPPARMLAALRGREHVALVLDGARAQQQMPVRRAGRRGECRRHQDQRERPHAAIELGKAQVVAHRQPDAAARQVDGHHVGARLDGLAFVVAFLAAREREQVDLVVAGDAPPVGAVDEARAAHARRIARSRAARCRRPARSPWACASRARNACCAPSPSVSRTASLSVARAPKMPKYSGSTTSRAPSAAAWPISGSACARFASTSPPETVCTAATRSARRIPSSRRSRG